MIFLRDAAGRQIQRIFPSGHEYVKDLAFSPSGWLLATGGRDGTVAVWNIR
jgi:WD40 repeat protein